MIKQVEVQIHRIAMIKKMVESMPFPLLIKRDEDGEIVYSNNDGTATHTPIRSWKFDHEGQTFTCQLLNN